MGGLKQDVKAFFFDAGPWCRSVWVGEDHLTRSCVSLCGHSLLMQVLGVGVCEGG